MGTEKLEIKPGGKWTIPTDSFIGTRGCQTHPMMNPITFGTQLVSEKSSIQYNVSKNYNQEKVTQNINVEHQNKIKL